MTAHKNRHQPLPANKKLSLNLTQSIDLGRSLLAQGNIAAAENVLGSILKRLPADPDALHLMGALRNMQGRPLEALALLEKAVELVSDDAGRWNDIGLVYAKLKRTAQATAAYQRSAEIAGASPMAAKAFDNLGRLQLDSDRVAAERSFREAIELAPEFGLAWYGLAQALIGQDRADEGIEASVRAIELLPKSMARELVAKALVRSGQKEKAVEFYQQWLQQEPHNPLITHHLTALTQPYTPEPASSAYIETTFDEFASTFDSKLALLNYQAPDLICGAIRGVYPDANATLDIADAGCGTGLCGPLVRPWARRLCGFDLSDGMLALARKRNVYSDLHKYELVNFLNLHPAEFDLLISADTLCYFGSLQSVMAASYRAVRAGGHVIYTVEASDDDTCPHRLDPSGRYAHSLVHVSTAATAAGLRLSCVNRVTLRTESGKPVTGWLVTLHRP